METDYYRICPVCGNKVYYKSKNSYDLCKCKNTKCRHCANIHKTSADLSVLLKNLPESYYWVGFIMADGHITDNKRLKLVLSLKDIDHLKKFKSYISLKSEIKIYKNSCGISVMDSVYIKSLCEKFNIKQNKTYNPPDISVFENIQEEKLKYALLAGFIDGDGNISSRLPKSNAFFLRIQLHSSWINILQIFHKMIDPEGLNTVKINNRGYAQFVISNTEILKNLKERILNLNIPILLRKWDIIDLEFQSRYKTAEQRRIALESDFKSGQFTQKQLAEKYHLSKSTISEYKHRYKWI